MYTLILRNNSTNEVFTYGQLKNVSWKRLFLQFNDIDIDAPDGEYTYAVFPCNRLDVEYDFKSSILDSILTVDNTDFELRDLNPRYGLLRIGNIVPSAKYDNTNKETYYYE